MRLLCFPLDSSLKPTADLCSTYIFALGRLRRPDLITVAVNQMEERQFPMDASTWSYAVTGLAAGDKPREALAVLARMRRVKIVPNEKANAFLLHCLGTACLVSSLKGALEYISFESVTSPVAL
jgi:pentatricopeptide repeat protein